MPSKRFGVITFDGESGHCTVLRPALGGPKVIGTFPVRVTPGPGGPAFDADEIARRLGEMDCRTLVMGLSLSQTVSEVVELPAMKKKDLIQALPFEAEHHLPLPLEEFLWTYTQVPGPRNISRCLVVGVRKAWADTTIEQFLERDVRLVEFRVTHLERAQQIAGRLVDGTIVALGSENIEWADVRKGVVGSLRSSPFHIGDNPAEWIERGLIRPPGAEGPGKLIILGKTCLPLAAEIRTRAGWDAACEDVDPALAVGRAFLRRRRREIRLTGTGGAEPSAVFRVLTGILLALAMILSYIYGQAPVWKQERALERIKTETAALKRRLKKGESTVDGYSAIQALGILKNRNARRNIPVAALGELARRLPEDAWLVNFDMNEKGKIEISGIADNSAGLIASLGASPRFRDVEWAGPVLMRDGEERFKIRMFWVEGKP